MKTYPNYPRASWHQLRNPAPWWHATLWTVVTECVPGAGIAFMRVSTAQEAYDYADKIFAQNPCAGIAVVPPASA